MEGMIVRPYNGPVAERFTGAHVRILKQLCDHVYPYKEGGQWYVIGSRGTGPEYKRLVYAHFPDYDTYEYMMGFKEMTKEQIHNRYYGG